MCKPFITVLMLFLSLNNASAGSSLILMPDKAAMENIRNNIGAYNTIGKTIDIPQPISTQNAGAWINAGGFSIWKLPIQTHGEYGTVVFFEKLIMPDGGEIKAYTPDSILQTPTFTENPNKKGVSFALPGLPANEIVVEIRIPIQKRNELEVEIKKIGSIIVNKLYRASKKPGFGDAPLCFANVNCSEGAPWQDQSRSVAKYMTIEGSDIGYCTGSLVNNTNQNCKNYFLTAQHCGMGATTAELGQFIFYFNYESPNCTNPASENGLTNQTVIGCSRKASSGTRLTLPPDGSDFQLLELNAIPASYNVYFAGWNRNAIEHLQGPGSIIQHPQGDIKKIAFWNKIQIAPLALDHLEVGMIASEHGDGTVVPMSSGSPVFDANKLIVGNVTHGSSGCISAEPGASVYGGMLFYHWDKHGKGADRQLKPWLDPSNSGVTTLAGKNQCGNVGMEKTRAGKTIFISHQPTANAFEIVSNDIIERTILYNTNGARVGMWRNLNSIPIVQLPNGLYFVTIKYSKGVFTTYFIKRN